MVSLNDEYWLNGGSLLHVFPIPSLPIRHLFDRRLEPLLSSLVGLSLGDPFNILFFIAVVELLERGKRVIYLTTDLANATSNNIYQRIGYRPVGDQYQFDFVAPA